jgi:hypothetical protein
LDNDKPLVHAHEGMHDWWLLPPIAHLITSMTFGQNILKSLCIKRTSSTVISVSPVVSHSVSQRYAS